VVDIEDAFLSLVQAAEDMSLKIHEDKTKYMFTGRSIISLSMISLGCYNFQQAEINPFLNISCFIQW
jgi:hypothetical protein